ncbi:MAG TPA: sigma-70 family RNA polymerase sigma factor [Bacilli bacterium]
MKWSHFLDMEQMNETDEYELLNELYRQMFIVAYSKVNNKSDALDIVQESWLKILLKLDSLKDRDKLLHWAKAIVSNTAVNFIKRKQFMKWVAFQTETPQSREFIVDAQMEERFRRKELYDSIAKLDEETGKMLICKYYYGFKDKDIAEALDFPVGTVKARIHRAKDRLRTLLTDE